MSNASAGTATDIKFVIGSRRLLSVSRELITVAYSLADLVSDTKPLHAKLGDAQGYRILSAPYDRITETQAEHPDYIIGGLQIYHRYYIDMGGSYDDYLSGFSAKTRSTFRRKQKKLADFSGGTLDVREYRTPDQLADFLTHAIPLSRRTYQARLLDSGLPESASARDEMMALSTKDSLRAYLLFINGKAVSYLYLPIKDGIISYAFLGYDTDIAHMSPGTVLQLEALERLFAEGRYRYFDFTEGEGAHKKMFGTGSALACSFLLLKPTLGNRLLLHTLSAFDGCVALAGKIAERTGAKTALRQILRG